MTGVVRAPERELQREEKKLYTRLRRVLWDYEPLRASHAEIFIDVEGQHVSLRGRVRTLPQKIIAETLVRRTSDVNEVDNSLVADPEVVRAVADVLAEDERTAPYVIRVESRHGIVTLRGEVPTADVGEAAVDLAAQVSLVSSVRSQLTTGGAPQPAIALSRPSAHPDVANIDAVPERA
jgi:hyperosmotically inducible protein